MKPGDTVRVKNCTGCTERFNGMIGKYLGAELWRDGSYYQVSFVPTGESCGYVFADNELEVVPQLTVGSKVTVIDCSYCCEFVDGNVITVHCGEPNKGVHEITEVGKVLPASDQDAYDKTLQFNDTIIRRISDGRVFFTQQRFLKEYVAQPKFKCGDFVVYIDKYYRITKVHDDLTYELSIMVGRYNEGTWWRRIAEGELKEVQ